MLTVTPRATQALSKLLRENDADPRACLLLAVERGGCAGMQYTMTVAVPSADDHQIELSEHARIGIAHDSIDYLKGCHIDYSDALTDAGFKIENPNAVRSCGCGTSFELPGQTTPALADGEACA